MNNYVPTKTEMDVLQILWKCGPSTVRFVHNKLNLHKEAVVYTSTLKLMQGMKEKGVLSRDESNMKHIYKPELQEIRVKSTVLKSFVDAIFNGSPANLMMALLGADQTTAKELEMIKQLIRDREDLNK